MVLAIGHVLRAHEALGCFDALPSFLEVVHRLLKDGVFVGNDKSVQPGRVSFGVSRPFALPVVRQVVSSLGLPRSCDACYDKVLIPTTYPRRESWWPRYIARAGRHTNCGESSGGPKGATNGSSSITKKRAKPMLSRSRTVPRAVRGLSASICFPDSL